MKKYKLIVLDRDGVINEDSDAYIKSPDEWHAIPGSLETMAKFNKADIKVAVITNQSGVARGFFTEKTLQAIHKKMLTELKKVGGHIDAIVYCPHHPDDNCDCRKPKPKMLLEILQQFNVTPEETLVIGDTIKEVQMAKTVDCDVILVKTGKGKRTIKKHADELTGVPVIEDLANSKSLLFA